MKTAEIKKRWLDYFAVNGHTVVPSASLISPDPSTLFTIAGVVPFIPYMLGEQTPPFKRATSVQKCLRTADIDEVGKTTRHGTFFQMNGNFSFGDYFKEDAIRFAWDLVTGAQSDGKYGFNADDIWVTVFEDDDEAEALWMEIAGLEKERIQRRGRKDNFWHTGAAGPGGPCTEIYVDRGSEFGKPGGPVVDEERYLEIWNLVFTGLQIENVKSKTEFDIVGPLKNKNIDTGLGLERVAYLLQGKDNMYEIDETFPVIARLQEISGKTYGANHEDDVRMRVVADHVRSAMMVVSDGVKPSNEGRGYVLRRLIRRSMRAIKLLGVDEKALPLVLPYSKDAMKASYPELEDDFKRIENVIYTEEDVFTRTLTGGINILDLAISDSKKLSKKQNNATPVLSGDSAFKLHDTYGFPIEMTLEIAHEQGVKVDEKEFRALMSEQKQRARDDAIKKRGANDIESYNELQKSLDRPNEFIGYKDLTANVKVLGIITDDGAKQFIEAPAEVQLVLNETPFYAESGGQLADHGTIVFDSGAILDVYDVQKPVAGLIVHKARLTDGLLSLDETGVASVDLDRRDAIARAHTSTHMIHKALQEEFGSDATQAGSENSPNRSRFDFHINGSVSKNAIDDIESRVNEKIRENLPVTDRIMGLNAAKDLGAMALFGEKYGDEVRVVTIGEEGWSRELCVGTHVKRVGDIGMITLLAESALGSGVRRIESLVSKGAVDHQARQRALVSQLTGMLGVPDSQIESRVQQMMSKLKDQQKTLEKLQKETLMHSLADIVKTQKKAGNTMLAMHNAGELPADALRFAAQEVKNRLGNDNATVTAIAGESNGKPVIAIALNDKAIANGLSAGQLVKNASKTLGGGGGGKADFAQGGGTDVAKLSDAFREIEEQLTAS
ncbi:MAG: alanine--tRNA ligase [Bifidobacteriaceae bacterium]|jgi:alanyl-tRNA synthetase|nr:alanine--tRNA ligase [Bifidobacteriaceae bacterium]